MVYFVSGPRLFLVAEKNGFLILQDYNYTVTEKAQKNLIGFQTVNRNRIKCLRVHVQCVTKMHFILIPIALHYNPTDNVTIAAIACC